MSIENVLYIAKATSTGGRGGRAVSSDNVLDIPLSTPRELGGAGGRGTNPEQLFSAAYSALLPRRAEVRRGQREDRVSR
jgi:lipoyl-dependent peroxiredoxin